jgi:hypothetical protein
MAEALFLCFCISYSIVILIKHRSNKVLSRHSFTHVSDQLVVAAAVAVTASDAIVVIIIIVLYQVHDAVCVAARVGEPDSSQVTAATSSPLPVRLQKLEISMHKHQLTHSIV